MTDYQDKENQRAMEMNPTPYERYTHEGRIIEESKEPGYCGSCSLAGHCEQVRDPESWIQSFLPKWYRVWKQAQTVPPAPRFILKTVPNSMHACVYDSIDGLFVDQKYLAKLLNDMVTHS